MEQSLLCHFTSYLRSNSDGNYVHLQFTNGDNPFIEEDYGLITDTYIDDSQDFGAYLDAGIPNQNSIKYFPENDVNQYSDSHPSILDGSFDTTVSTMDEGFTEGEPYLDYGLITVFDDRYGFGGISVSEEARHCEVIRTSYRSTLTVLRRRT